MNRLSFWTSTTISGHFIRQVLIAEPCESGTPARGKEFALVVPGANSGHLG